MIQVLLPAIVHLVCYFFLYRKKKNASNMIGFAAAAGYMIYFYLLTRPDPEQYREVNCLVPHTANLLITFVFAPLFALFVHTCCRMISVLISRLKHN